MSDDRSAAVTRKLASVRSDLVDIAGDYCLYPGDEIQEAVRAACDLIDQAITASKRVTEAIAEKMADHHGE